MECYWKEIIVESLVTGMLYPLVLLFINLCGNFRISLAHRINYYVTYLFRCENGILALKFSKKRVHMQGTGRVPYQFEEPTATFITSSPKMMDPYERSNLYIGESNIEGIVLHPVRWYVYIHI